MKSLVATGDFAASGDDYTKRALQQLSGQLNVAGHTPFQKVNFAR